MQNSMQIYHYHPTTGVCTGSDIAERDPIGGDPLIPAHATAIRPPKNKKGHVACFDTRAEKWAQRIDLRGTVYDTTSGEPEQWVQPGPLPPTKTQAKPATPFDVYQGDAWVTDTEAKAREEALRALPSIDEQLDAIWMQFNYMRLNGENLVSNADSVLNKILAAKGN